MTHMKKLMIISALAIFTIVSTGCCNCPGGWRLGDGLRNRGLIGGGCQSCNAGPDYVEGEIIPTQEVFTPSAIPTLPGPVGPAPISG